jgi:hypothetical protein
LYIARFGTELQYLTLGIFILSHEVKKVVTGNLFFFYLSASGLPWRIAENLGIMNNNPV